MGTDKALQLWKGQTFISSILDASKTIENKIVLVSSKPAHHKLGYKYVSDIQSDKGPVSGVTSALLNTTTEWNLILSCDIPLLKADFISWLLTNYNPKFDATICTVNKKKMPLTSIYNKRCKTVFGQHLKKNQLKVMDVLKDLNVNYVEVPTQFHSQLTNVNTPEQLKAIS